MKKICKKCGGEKEVQEFYLKDKNRYDTVCKSCRGIYFHNKYIENIVKMKEISKNNQIKFKDKMKKYRDENKSERLEYNKKWRIENKEKIKLYSKYYAEKHKGEITKKIKKYKTINKEKLLEKDKIRYINNRDKKIKYYEDNKDRILDRQKNRRLNNSEDVLKIDAKWRNKNRHVILWRSLLRRAIIQLKQEKFDTTLNSLGYSAIELKEHIEKNWTEGMNWKNYGDWHVDHIRSVGTFDSTSLPSEVNALSNLNPMWSTNRFIDDIFYEGNLNKGKKMN